MLAYTEGGHLIKKDYSKWLDDDGKAPRFTPAQLRFIRAAKTPKKGLIISDITTQLPLQSATLGAEMNGDIDTQLPLQSATVGPEITVTNCNGRPSAPLPNVTATVTECNSSRYKAQQRDTVIERAAEDFLDSKICSLPLAGGAPDARDPEDSALVREAITLLGSSPNTEHLGLEVGRVHNSATNVNLPGWKWVVAAYAACRTSGHVGAHPMKWKYFFGIVRDAERGEYERIRAESAPDPGPATPGELSRLPRKQTPAERRKAEAEAWRRVGEQLNDEET
jgi:hypothetical protein